VPFRVSEVRAICRGLILRVLLRLGPGDSLPAFRRGVKMSLTDPRNTQLTSSLAMFPETNWDIKPEWILSD